MIGHVFLANSRHHFSSYAAALALVRLPDCASYLFSELPCVLTSVT